MNPVPRLSRLSSVMFEFHGCTFEYTWRAIADHGAPSRPRGSPASSAIRVSSVPNVGSITACVYPGCGTSGTGNTAAESVTMGMNPEKSSAAARLAVAACSESSSPAARAAASTRRVMGRGGLGRRSERERERSVRLRAVSLTALDSGTALSPHSHTPTPHHRVQDASHPRPNTMAAPAQRGDGHRLHGRVSPFPGSPRPRGCGPRSHHLTSLNVRVSLWPPASRRSR